MAVLYMLHVESKLALEKPRDNIGAVGVDAVKRELLKRFTNWVTCQCDANGRCGREWNFANEVGLSRKTRQSSGGGLECKVLELFDGRKWKASLGEKYVRCLENMREKWQAVN
jgi:hypothetical protein